MRIKIRNTFISCVMKINTIPKKSANIGIVTILKSLLFNVKYCKEYMMILNDNQRSQTAKVQIVTFAYQSTEYREAKMNLNDLAYIEEQLGVKLPEPYKKVMLDYPFKDEYYDFVKGDLFDEPNKIIELNQQYRTNGRDKKRWPHRLFIIGAIDENNINFIDLDSEKEEIFFLSDEDKFTEKNIKKLLFSYDFEEFIDQMKHYQEIYNNP